MPHTGSSSISAMVGAVLGGVVGIILIALRRRAEKEEPAQVELPAATQPGRAASDASYLAARGLDADRVERNTCGSGVVDRHSGAGSSQRSDGWPEASWLSGPTTVTPPQSDTAKGGAEK
ncbi:MAG: hypothetical protein LBH48_06270 [Bifidobacteriaceae bacterium]|nr:hypothetical protein [Bifidobacteriaceae bacterium]